MLLALKSVWNGLGDLTCDIKTLENLLATDPESNHSGSITPIQDSISALRLEWKKACIPTDHPLKGELEACSTSLARLRSLTTPSKGSATPTSLDSSITSFYRPEREGGKLPPIALPCFKGDIMEWSTFWQKFSDSVDKRDHLSNTTKLTYLRQAIKDPAVQTLLNSPTEGPDTYKQLVKALHKRYERTKKIHRDLVSSIMQMPEARNTSTDLRKLVDETTSYVGSIKQTGYFSLETFLTSIIYSRLPYKVRLDWDDHHSEEKVVAPYTKLLEFVSNRAYSLADNQSVPSKTDSAEKTSSRATDKKPNHRSNSGKNHANTVTAPSSSSSSYKWDCVLCKTEKHPLHICPKLATLTVLQRLGHVKAKNLCTNCLAGGHPTTNCKSTYRCRSCGQQHHTTLHQESAAPPVNNASALSRQVPDALMTTAQVLLIGPRGQELKARALIDSGAGLSLISHKVAQTLGLPLTPNKLQISGVQGISGKPAKFLTHLVISPLLTHLVISPLHNRQKRIQCTPVVLPKVTGDLPPEQLEPVHDLPHMKGLHLADTTYNIPGKIDVLLGADLAPQIMSKRLLRTGGELEPMAQATEFGWVISGPARSATRKDSSTIHSATYTHLQPEEEAIPLESQICQFWSAEEAPGDEEPSLSQMEKQAESHYQSNLVQWRRKMFFQRGAPVS